MISMADKGDLHLRQLSRKRGRSNDSFLEATSVGRWPGPGFAMGSSKVTVAGRATMPKVSFLESPRTHTFGHEQTYGFLISKHVAHELNCLRKRSPVAMLCSKRRPSRSDFSAKDVEVPAWYRLTLEYLNGSHHRRVVQSASLHLRRDLQQCPAVHRKVHCLSSYRGWPPSPCTLYLAVQRKAKTNDPLEDLP